MEWALSERETRSERTSARSVERRGKNIKFSVLLVRGCSQLLVCFMGHKLLAFRLRTAIFTRLFSLVELRSARRRSLGVVELFARSRKKCFYMKNWNLYFIFHHEKYCWMDFYKYACFFLLRCSPACAPLLPLRASTLALFFFLRLFVVLSRRPPERPDWFIPTRRRLHRRLYDGRPGSIGGGIRQVQEWRGF